MIDRRLDDSQFCIEKMNGVLQLQMTDHTLPPIYSLFDWRLVTLKGREHCTGLATHAIEAVHKTTHSSKE